MVLHSSHILDLMSLGIQTSQLEFDELWKSLPRMHLWQESQKNNGKQFLVTRIIKYIQFQKYHLPPHQQSHEGNLVSQSKCTLDEIK